MSAATAPPPPQQLVLQKEVFTAYLQPLLKKHELQQILTYEDLTASWQAAMAVLGNNKVADSGTKTAVRGKLTALHQSQVLAYREAAGAALLQWAETLQLPALVVPTTDNHLSHSSSAMLSAYQKVCRDHAAATLPAWRNVMGSKQLQAAYSKIDERAAEHYHKLKHRAVVSTKKAENNHDDEGDDEDEDGEIEEGEEEDDANNNDAIAEGDDEDGEEGEEAEDDEEKQGARNIKTTTAAATTSAKAAKKGGILAKKKAVTSKIKMVNKKKSGAAVATTATAGATSNRGRRGRSRGGGRGGGGSSNSNSSGAAK